MLFTIHNNGKLGESKQLSFGGIFKMLTFSDKELTHLIKRHKTQIEFTRMLMHYYWMLWVNHYHSDTVKYNMIRPDTVLGSVIWI